eukprot:TRINITY_DN3464_c0_g1_i7.p1 TRINITY_DN3464_c0_g1~~TRINITY_DN3464_c0_g1_i7.p1  ORF type:complete len:102 (-),score=9.68 TRINITY_DN3464_c0_g1_i7:58-363(-)
MLFSSICYLWDYCGVSYNLNQSISQPSICTHINYRIASEQDCNRKSTIVLQSPTHLCPDPTPKLLSSTISIDKCHKFFLFLRGTHFPLFFWCRVLQATFLV